MTDAPLSYEQLKQLIAADCDRIEHESEVRRAKNPPKKKRRNDCGCTATWVCVRHRGETE